MWPPCAEDVESWRSDRSATWIIPSLCCQSYLTYLLWSDLLNNTIADSCSVPPSRAVQQGDPFRAGIFPLWLGLLKERRFCGPCIIFWHSLCYTNYSVITLQICTHTHTQNCCLSGFCRLSGFRSCALECSVNAPEKMWGWFEEHKILLRLCEVRVMVEHTVTPKVQSSTFESTRHKCVNVTLIILL